MSAALYAIRLMWHSDQRGDFGCDGAYLKLRSVPSVMRALKAVEIEYEPEVRVSRMRGMFDGWRDMNHQECTTVRAWCVERAAAVWAAFQE